MYSIYNTYVCTYSVFNWSEIIYNTQSVQLSQKQGGCNTQNHENNMPFGYHHNTITALC